MSSTTLFEKSLSIDDIVMHFKNQEWDQLEELQDYFNQLLCLVEEEEEFNSTLARLCLDYFIYRHKKKEWVLEDTKTLSRLADTLKLKGDLDHALQLIELQPSKSFTEYRIILECYLIKRPQWVKEADDLLKLKDVFSDDDKKYLQLIYDIYTEEEQFLSYLEKYQESKSSFRNKMWLPLALGSGKKVMDLTNIILLICISKEQYEIGWDIYESMEKEYIDQTCVKTMIKMGSNGFYSSLLLKKGKHPQGEEEELKWEGRCWYYF
jgi:hypothetical protein